MPCAPSLGSGRATGAGCAPQRISGVCRGIHSLCTRTRLKVRRLITEAGRIPVERDTLYHAVTRTEDSFTVAV